PQIATGLSSGPIPPLDWDRGRIHAGRPVPLPTSSNPYAQSRPRRGAAAPRTRTLFRGDLHPRTPRRGSNTPRAAAAGGHGLTKASKEYYRWSNGSSDAVSHRRQLTDVP